MCVAEYSYKVEFKGRGAAHYHGILWLDLDKLEQMVRVIPSNKSDIFEYDIRPIKEEGEELQSFKELDDIMHNTESLTKNEERKDELLKKFPFKCIQSAFQKLRLSGEIDKI